VSYPCPFCRTPADPVTGCPGCGRGPDRDAAEVVRLDAEIPVLTARLAAARDTVTATDAQLRDAWRRRNSAAARVQAAIAAQRADDRSAVLGVPASMQPGVPSAARSGVPASPPAPARTPEASTRLVQNALFLLGGLLLAVAAIVFTAVAWTTFGVGGRAALLAGFTAAALAVPPLALRRSLGATAETFAAVGLLLVLLDGYAAWYVDLFGIADVSGWGYAGAVCAVTAAVAVGYEHLTGLIGPRFAALIATQPVLPLLLAPVHPDATGWSFILSAVAVLNLVFIHLRREGTGAAATLLRVAAYLLGGVAALSSGVCGLIALTVADRIGPAAAGGAALITSALLLVAGAVVARSPAAQATTGALLIVAVAVAAGRCAAIPSDAFAPVAVALVAALLAVAVTATARRLPAAVRRGPWVGALVVIAGPALMSVAGALAAAMDTVIAAHPVLGADLATGTGRNWHLPVTLALLTAGITVLLPRARRLDAVLAGMAFIAVAAPAGLYSPWWSAPVFDLVVAAVAVTLALLSSRPVLGLRAHVGWSGGIAGLLTAHAVTVAFGRPGTAAATLAAIALLGMVTAAAGRRIPGGHRVGGPALTTGLLAVPAAAFTTAVAAGVVVHWQTRITLGAAVLLTAGLRVVARRLPCYRPFAMAAALVAAAVVPLWVDRTTDSPAVYAAIALLAIAVAWTTPAAARPGAGQRGWAICAAVAPLLMLLAASAGAVATVLLAPYGWLEWVWIGRPAGVGVDPSGLQVGGTDALVAGVAVATVLAAAATAVVVHARAGRRAATWTAAPPLAVAVLLALLAAGAPWPVVPAVTLIAGLAGALMIALRRPSGPGTAGFVTVAAALTGAGLAGALPTQPATLAALAAVGVTGAVAGAAGRTLPVRVTGWLWAVGAAAAFGFTVGRAAHLSLAGTAFAVLAASALALALGTVLTGHRPAEAVAVQAAAHGGAVAALLLAVGSARYAAAVCTLWGVAVGVRALRPGEPVDRRRTLVVVAATLELGGWWLLIGAERVSLMEAYTLPAAVVALLGGWLALRSRPELTSWVAYGPALAAALLPTLASVLIGGDGHLLRRLLLGAGALGVVVLGAFARQQAPVLMGGGVLLLVALHELVLVWELVPRWIPLALGGLLLVGLAMTLERRRRDLARVRAAVTRMS
jgi:hypothetical protein